MAVTHEGRNDDDIRLGVKRGFLCGRCDQQHEGEQEPEFRKMHTGMDCDLREP